MAERIFYIVDVFAEGKYAGNQLAVFRNSEDLSRSEMQRIAREMNYSETTFILSDEERNGGYDVRIFTPKEEIPFAGHPTLGTAYVIQREVIAKPVEAITLNLKIGPISVTFDRSGEEPDILWMKQAEPTFGQILDSEDVSRVLSIRVSEIHGRFPVQEVSTGLPFIITPLKQLDALKRIRILKDRYFKLIEGIEAKALLSFCPEARNEQNDLSVRVHADYYGVPEDPATGSANGCLAAYLVKYRYFDKNSIDLRVEQGHEIGRPSLLFLKAESFEEKIDVFVGGNVVSIAKGVFV